MTISSNQTVYFGPSTTTYPSVGTVFSSDPITWLWKEGSWYFIEYPVTGGHKRGYIPASVVNGASNDTTTPNFSSLSSNAKDCTVASGGNTYYGPDKNSYPSAGSVSTGETVKYLGYTKNNYNFIEYSVGSTGQKKRAFFVGGFASGGGGDEPSVGSVQTKMRSSQSVLYGPGNNSNSYQSIGSVSAGESVKAIVAEADSLWVQIEYDVGSTGYKKRGYVAVSTTELSNVNNLPHTSQKGNLTVSAAGNVYSGPSTSKYQSSGSLSYNESVLDLGYEENGYKLVEYNVTATSYKKRGYFPSSSLSSSSTPSGGGETGDMASYRTYKQNDHIPSNLPMGGATVTQGFNDKTTNNKGHLGYDLDGISSVRSLFDGVVERVHNKLDSANGRTVCVRHTVGGQTFYSTYCHMASIRVSENQRVSAGDVLGVVGGSGYKDGDYADHVHVCVYTGNPTTDPYGYCSKLEDRLHKKTFEETAKQYYNQYYYGPNDTQFPRCGGVCFYDPYGVVTSNAAVIKEHHP